MATAQVQVADIFNYGRFMLNDALILRCMQKVWSDKETLQCITPGCMILLSVERIARHDVCLNIYSGKYF